MNDIPKRPTGDYTRRLVSIPKDLDDEMRQHPEVNWSAVAAKAFEEALKKIGSKK